MAIITPRQSESTIFVKTKTNSIQNNPGDWWNSSNKKEMCEKFLGTVGFLKELNQYRYRQASLYIRMYGNLPLIGWAGSTLGRLSHQNQLPMDRPTMSVVTSCIDTLCSRITQVEPRPVFLTDNGDYKKRTLAKSMNPFIWGEFYQTDAYKFLADGFKYACVVGTGAIKILENQKNKVELERRLAVDLLTDPNDAFYGKPRQLYELKLMDRMVLASMFPKYKADIEKAEQSYPDTSGQSTKTVSDLVTVAEGWHLASGPNAKDGYHVIACTEGILFEETWDKECFPFVFLKYSPHLVGPWAQGICERLMGTQMEINKLLITMSRALNSFAVPRIFIEEGSKIVKAHLNNEIGSIITYRGTPPIFNVSQCMPPEAYDQLQRHINYAYQEIGVSQLSSSSEKPAGLTSGTALREYDDIQTDRFATISKMYENAAIELAYQIIDKATDIAERDGKYETIYPNKKGIQEIDLPAVKKLKENPFVIQCYASSSLPKEPSGRLQTVTEWMQAGMISMDEGRRLMDLPDTEQSTQLAIAPEERILKVLDEIVEDGKYTPPDPFMKLDLAETKVLEYYNLYAAKKIEESKLQLLRNFYTQIQAIKMQSMSPQPTGQPPNGSPPLANPMPSPSSDLIPNVPMAA